MKKRTDDDILDLVEKGLIFVTVLFCGLCAANMICK